MSYKLTPGVLGRRRREKKVATEFIILIDTALAGSASDTMQLPIRGTDMTIDWGDGFVQTEVTQTALPAAANWITRVYPDGGGVKQIKVTGLDGIRFNNQGDRLKLLEIQNWGETQWDVLVLAFFGCSNMIGTFNDIPNLGTITNISNMFRNASLFNSNIGNWDVSNVQVFTSMFFGATAFNQDIGNWNMSNASTLINMFYIASNFNQDISNWDVSNVTNMASMFLLASNFNKDISGWNVGNVTAMGSMFFRADSFNQDLSGWCVEKIASRPNDFDLNANSWVYNANGDTGSTAGVDPVTIIKRPIWGTCPE